jgi:outer membrane lipoprotein-sorting protein
LILSLSSSAISNPAYEIVKKSDSLIHGISSYGDVEMTITNPYFERTLKMKVWNERRRKVFIRILSPAKEAGIGTLKIGSEMWNYLPAIEKVIKIPPSMMMCPWMGSDFTNDDVVRDSSIVEDYDHQIMTEEVVEGFRAFKIEAVPKPNAPVVWGKIYFWVRKSDNVPLRKEYYDEKGKLIKLLEFKEIKPMGGRIIPTYMVMHSVLKEKSLTTLRIIKCQFDLAIPDSIFSLRNLQSGK